MLDFSDKRWTEMEGGYGVKYDPRGALRRLEEGHTEDAWEELWNELHHQGNIGVASYASVPHLVRIHAQRGIPDWNTYALIGTIEIERNNHSNPTIPDWLEGSYREAWEKLLEMALEELTRVDDETTITSILGIIALAKGHRNLGRVVLYFTEDERLEILKQYYGS